MSDEILNRRMSQTTYDLLIRRKADLEAQIAQKGAESSGHQRASIHDDAGAENALNLLRANLQRIGNLKFVEIIQPRGETTSVGMGNEVEVQYFGEDTPEKFVVLGYDDTLWREDLRGKVITPESPIGEAILGKNPGDRVTFKVKERPIEVTIRQVRKGSF